MTETTAGVLIALAVAIVGLVWRLIAVGIKLGELDGTAREVDYIKQHGSSQIEVLRVEQRCLADRIAALEADRETLAGLRERVARVEVRPRD